MSGQWPFASGVFGADWFDNATGGMHASNFTPGSVSPYFNSVTDNDFFEMNNFRPGALKNLPGFQELLEDAYRGCIRID